MRSTNYILSTIVNGTLTITRAPLIVSASGTAEYGNPFSPAFYAAFTGFRNGDGPSIFTGILDFAAPENPAAGSYQIPGTGMLSADNYVVLPTLVFATLTIAPAPLTMTARDATREYGLPNPGLTATFTGFRRGEGVSVLSGAPSLSAPEGVPVGSYPISAGRGTLNAANYVISALVDGTLTVAPAPLTMIARDAAREYGVANPPFNATFLGFRQGDTATVLSGEPFLSTVASAGSAVGSYPISAARGTLSAANYTLSIIVDGTLSVLAPKPFIFNSKLIEQAFMLSVPTAVGANYSLESKESTTDGSWNPGQTLPGDGGTITLTNNAATHAARFYRVRVQ